MPKVPDDVLIRPARAGDEMEIFRLIRELARFEHLEHQLQGGPAQLGEAFFGAHPSAECFVAEHQQATLVGYAIFYPTFSTFLARPGLWLEDVFVVEPMRGKGIGRGLFAAVAGIARRRNVGRLEWAVLDWNRRAITFYDSMGAKMLRDWRICRLEREMLSRNFS